VELAHARGSIGGWGHGGGWCVVGLSNLCIEMSVIYRPIVSLCGFLRGSPRVGGSRVCGRNTVCGGFAVARSGLGGGSVCGGPIVPSG